MFDNFSCAIFRLHYLEKSFGLHFLEKSFGLLFFVVTILWATSAVLIQFSSVEQIFNVLPHITRTNKGITFNWIVTKLTRVQLNKDQIIKETRYVIVSIQRNQLQACSSLLLVILQLLKELSHI